MVIWTPEKGLIKENFEKMLEEAANQPERYACLNGITENGKIVEMELEFFQAINGNFDFTGEGCLVYPNMSRYEGQFKDGKWNGEGKVVLGNGFVTHKGYWENGKMIYGAYNAPDGSESYEGEWKVSGNTSLRTGSGTKTSFAMNDGVKMRVTIKCNTFIDGEPFGYTEETIERDGYVFRFLVTYDENGHCKGITEIYDNNGKLVVRNPYEN
ncbi:MAG: hypothetical protein LBT59_24150 [Clostridiales bacterium]|jgi:hypothetical protein|nr:hypothetical protein [Clostridiales bacterium]